MRIKRAVAAMAAVLALAAGCGGDVDEGANGDSTTAGTGRNTTTAAETTTTGEQAGEGLCEVAGRLDQESAVALFERPPADIAAFFDASDDLFAAGLDVVPPEFVTDLETVRQKYADFAAHIARYGYDFQAVIAALESDPELAAAFEDVDALAFDEAAGRLRDLVATECGIVIDPLQLATG